MKFAKELQEDLVPEWRAKYLDYKLGKKKVKAVSRALIKANRAPQTPHSATFRRREPPAPHPSFASPRAQKQRSPTERDLLRPDSEDTQQDVSYGSIAEHGGHSSAAGGPPSLRLPGPAMSPLTHANGDAGGNGEHDLVRRPTTSSSDSLNIGRPHHSSGSPVLVKPVPRRVNSMPDDYAARNAREGSLIKRLFSDRFHHHHKRGRNGSELEASPFLEYQSRNREFFEFLKDELGMVESFYKSKEHEATERLEVLKTQLHRMRDLRVREVQKVRQRKLSKLDESDGNRGLMDQLSNDADNALRHSSKTRARDPSADVRPWYAPIEHKLGIGHYRFGRNTEALERMLRDREVDKKADPSGSEELDAALQANGTFRPDEADRDYARRSKKDEKVPYDRAKRLLKSALQEFYRGLELLKSYTLLNRTAFRKINKKYDKAVQARPTFQFFNEKVNHAYFVESNVVEQCIVQVEDLFARYFAGGNRKVAISKLRGRTKRPEDLTDSMFRSGLFLGAGTGLAIPGLLYAGGIITQNHAINIPLQTPTSYLLQLYGGYFLMLFLFLFFCMDAGIWTRHKINYVFIFEFDTRHNLNWRQLLEIPSFLYFLLGLTLLLNFHPWTRDANNMFIYWPVILVGLSLLIIFTPLPIFYHRSRLWFAQSSFRLLLAGLFSVEFRDFFLGDMFCSLTYSLGNVEVFFCLYAHNWNLPTQCNSSHSRLLGFFSALPGIWRFLQCLRRYGETKNAFPHLLNCGKYLATIVFYMTLSIYRIDPTDSKFVTFVVFATVNSIYTSLWDVFMDWSLGHPGAPNKFLRAELGYKKTWWYYGAVIIDPLLRFNWIFYAIFRSQLQHSAILSFFVSFSEIIRRGIWTIFRVENEHCTNVGRFRASRDVSLPYVVPEEQAEREAEAEEDAAAAASPQQSNRSARPADEEAAHRVLSKAQRSGTGERFLPDSPLQRMTTAISLAHAQDFVRRRVPGAASASPDIQSTKRREQEAESDEDDDVEDEDEEMEARAAREE